jgi:hypothetical protein
MPPVYGQSFSEQVARLCEPENYALTLASNEWVLSLDADEIMSEQARIEGKRL